MSATYTPFSSLTLCTFADLKSEQRELETILALSGDELIREVGIKIGLAKEQIRQELMDYLPDIFGSTMSYYGYGNSLVYNDWLMYIGYSYTDLDKILDVLANPQDLKRTAVAYTLRLLVWDAMNRYRANFQAESDLLWALYHQLNGSRGTRTTERIEGQCETRFKVGVRSLKFDMPAIQNGLQKSGFILDQGRVKINKTMWRV